MPELTRTPRTTPPSPPPPNITRTFITTPSGSLELLSSLPSTPHPTKPPLLLLHGGFGSALCYRNFLPTLSSYLYPSYSLSLRGHGSSFRPPYWSLYFTPLSTLLTDVHSAIHHITSLHPTSPPPILIGHSSGGGLAQAYLSATNPEYRAQSISGLVLLAAIPGTGNFWVNYNWWKMDLWFFPRMVWDWGHPKSPLKNTELVKRAFFGDEVDEAVVEECEREMPEFESMAWPMGMMAEFCDRGQVIERVVGRNSGREQGEYEWEKWGILVVGAEKDRLVVKGIPEGLVEWYKGAAREKGLEERDVGFVEVRGSGHHLMLDREWETAAREVVRWLETGPKK